MIRCEHNTDMLSPYKVHISTVSQAGDYVSYFELPPSEILCICRGILQCYFIRLLSRPIGTAQNHQLHLFPVLFTRHTDTE